MRVNHFSFQVEPMIFAPDEAKVLKVTIEVDGLLHSIEQCLPDRMPFESEIEYYGRRAIESIQELLRK